ncbi:MULTISPECIES: DUF2218 domain-containing protein [Sulfitobacter]|uniref:DUF2218 domain-containing protein n=1 Tax=Sulfitobacter TaxID=60136 RepID=UPI002307FE63|nr:MULTISPECIES: DUF2218 domain-containing protein [Sulfitobacter]MDF3383420.1 DUF2218 domain-containing protein [Sulfitobacter sp. Ks11]MDF3386838.1 DUF2218 domain-containing protein [Sulfitobacter sp. M85]MDF3390258.1 DUF2218 domain-containing protein [Sulfitobacter sp. Ks16]MDF3400895.1 DUF2218 domain-containing protein [Sulfitobacter sp. KE39]MDF3404316.1 DUF2218 domain-containing protein [Sulfitobacter sp. Ks35]
MPTTTGFYQTENGSKYLQQLCKHFGHKIETSYDSEKGWAAFEMGTAYMTADSKGLTVTATLDDPEMVPALHSVIDRHLETFAFREAEKNMVWTVE